jgi:hypothetical protein
MFRNLSRANVIQLWFGAVVLIVAGAIVLGVSATVGTATMLGALALVPPAIVLMLWRGAESGRTASDVIHDTNR